jgi:DNA-binding winged helix-turn-helix (wHTH) protein
MKFDLFGRKKDKIIENIAEENSRRAAEAAQSAKALRDLLRKDGITLQIYIATGGGKRR